MIPRFIILKPKPSTIDKLVALGFEIKSNPLSEDVLVLGGSLLNSSTVPAVKNPLIKVYGNHQEVEIYEQAALQLKWTNNTNKVELVLGDPQKGKVIITPLGVMIDSCIIPITVFRKLQGDFNKFRSPFIASHPLIINPMRPFFTVGCADYSLTDLSTIIAAYDKLLEPAP